MLRIVYGGLIASALLARAAGAGAQEIRFGGEAFAVTAGATISIPIELEATENVTGFSFGVSHGASLSLECVRASAELAAVAGVSAAECAVDSEFFFVDTTSFDGAGFIAAAIFSSTAENRFLAPGTHQLFTVDYAASPTATGSATLSITGALGDPSVALVIDVNGGLPRSFEGSSVDVTFSSGYRRGDVDGNRNFALTDAVRILNYLFRGGALGTCPPVLNVDGSIDAGTPGVEDLADISITDAIQLLRFVFLSGIAPAEPFASCGASPNTLAPEMACTGFAGCES